jgi:hypothetical protein
MGRGNKAPKVMARVPDSKVSTAAELESNGDWGSPDFGQKPKDDASKVSDTKK